MDNSYSFFGPCIGHEKRLMALVPEGEVEGGGEEDPVDTLCWSKEYIMVWWSLVTAVKVQ